jgi:hypothetical protein
MRGREGELAGWLLAHRFTNRLHDRLSEARGARLVKAGRTAN